MTKEQANNMKLRDDIKPEPPEGHDALWELIPWYVNGSLPAEEAARVEAYALENDAFAEEIGQQTVLAQDVAKTDPFDVPLERSWETLRAQVEADVRARTPAKATGGGWLAALQGRSLAAFGGLAAACVALVIAVQFAGGPTGDFQTLTSGDGMPVPMVQFQPAEAANAEALADLLAPLGVISVTGPSDAGVYAATLADGADVDAIAAEMMARSDILFAAPEAGQ